MKPNPIVVRILHVDDDPVPLEQVKRGLTSLYSELEIDHRTVLGTRADAIAYLKESSFVPDFIIIDMQMLHVNKDEPLKNEYYLDNKEGKRLLESLHKEFGHVRKFNPEIIFFTKLTRFSNEAMGVRKMGYHVLHKITSYESIETLKELIVRFARRKT